MPSTAPEPTTVTRPDFPPGYLNVMGYVNESEVNGPGCRAVVWLQGCHRQCVGCFNPDSWSFAENQLISIEDLAASILSHSRNTGVTFSGGEPFWQAPALTLLARRLKAAGLNTMSFTGFTLAELRGDNAPPQSQALLAELDILVDGPYLEHMAIHDPRSPVSSRNQRVHFLNLALAEEPDWASDQAEVHVFKDGSRIITGYWGQAGWMA